MKQVNDHASKSAQKTSMPFTRWGADVLQLHGPEQAELLQDHVLEVNPDGLIQALRARIPGEAVEYD